MSGVPNRRLLVTMLLLWSAAAVAFSALRLTYGERPAYVKVRWATSIGDVERARLERQYRLTPRDARDERTWSYLLTDVSRHNIRAIVRDPAVEDTHEINRMTFRPVAAAATRPAYLGPGPPWAGSFLEWLSRAFVSLGALALGVLALSAVGRPMLLQPPLAALAALLTSPHSVAAVPLRAWSRGVAARVPEASAEAVAIFRLIFGAACVWYLGWGVGPQSIASANPESGFQRMVLAVFEPTPLATDSIRPWIIFWALLFIAGAWARLSYVMLTIGAIVWAALFTTRFGTHPVAAPLMAMICLVPSRWGDAWSVDAWWRSRRRRDGSTSAVPPRIYGYTMWMPGLVFATSFAAAAVAKLREGGVTWVTNGTVKYHFLSDAHQAPVDWGLRLAQHESVAVFMSFAAIVPEAMLIVGVFSKRYRYRAAAGAGGLALLLGFALFQGVIWPLWWLMLMSFVPWHRVRPFTVRPPEPAAARRLSYARMQLAQIGIAFAVITQQIAVSAANVEYAPLLSTWDMYATTYTGPEDYESKSGLTYVLIARFDDGARRACDLTEHEATELVEAGMSSSSRRVLSRCFPSASTVRSVLIEGRRRPVDWTKWEFGEEETVTVSGPIAVDAAR